MSDNATEISEKLESIIQNLLGKEFLINPFFRISKSTPEQLTPYKYINLRCSRELLALYLFVSIPINFVKIILQIFFSLFFSYQYLYFKPKSYSTEVLFVSHAIGANIIKKDSDQFFALIPEYCAEKNLNTTIVYTNHTKYGYNKNLNLLNLKTNKVNRFLLPKFLKPKELIKYYLTITVMFIKCVRIGVVNYFTDPLNSKILFSAANSFFKRPTYANYLLLLRIKDFYSENAIKVIFMTLEGHSYEQYLVNEINQAAPSLQVVLYQHSPITRAHLGIKNFMEKNIDNIIIMTTGTYYTNYLKQLSNIPEFVLIGSNKAEHLQENKEIYKSKTLLFAPEGTIAATKSFLKLIRLMRKKDPIHHYLLRLHPNLPRNIGVYFLIANLKKKQNFSISGNSLSADLNLAKFVFYRSSAVGLQALNSSATPIFYSDQGNNMLNVIPPNSEVFYTAGTSKDALDIVNTLNNKKSIKDKKIIFESLFSDFIYQNLDSIIIKN
jgi:hypothetical protein